MISSDRSRQFGCCRTRMSFTSHQWRQQRRLFWTKQQVTRERLQFYQPKRVWCWQHENSQRCWHPRDHHHWGTSASVTDIWQAYICKWGPAYIWEWTTYLWEWRPTREADLSQSAGIVHRRHVQQEEWVCRGVCRECPAASFTNMD